MREMVTRLLLVMLMLVVLTIIYCGARKKKQEEIQISDFSASIKAECDKNEEDKTQNEEASNDREMVSIMDVLLEVNVTSEISAVKRAKIHRSSNKQESLESTYEYYIDVCNSVEGETNQWKQDKMAEMVCRVMTVELTIEEYVLACYTSVALASAISAHRQCNSPKIKSVSLGAIMCFDYLYLKCTSIWLKFNTILLSKERHDRLSTVCAALDRKIIDIHEEGNVEQLVWDWDTRKGVDTARMEKWVKNSCLSLDKQRKTAVRYDDLKWWETNEIVDLREKANEPADEMVSAKFIGCKHIDCMVIMGKAKVLERKVLVISGCKSCMDKEMTEDRGANQDKIWIIL